MSDILKLATQRIKTLDYSYLNKKEIYGFVLFIFILITIGLYFGYKKQIDRQISGIRPYLISILSYFDSLMRFIRVHSRNIIIIWFFIVFIFIIVLVYPNTDYRII